MRISIIGHSGSGKTVLANKISQKLGIRHLHLDRLWMTLDGHKLRPEDGGGKDKVRAVVRQKVVEFMNTHDAWVSDGWYRKLQPLIVEKADLIIFLDIPLWRRLISCVHRTFFTERHPELSKWDDVKYLREVVRRTYVHDEAMHALVREHADKVKILHSYKEIDRYLAELKK